LSLERSHIPYTLKDSERWHLIFLGPVAVGLAVSSLLCLKIILVRWEGEYATFSDEVNQTVLLIRDRSRIVEAATVTSACSLIFLAVALGY
jgi:hypothetical protein